MASWMIHLRIADLLLDRIPDLDGTAFAVGSIAPDSGAPNADGTAFDPPKEVSHFKAGRDGASFYDVGRFRVAYFTPDRIRSFSRRTFSFFLGYLVHLLTDTEWVERILRPAFVTCRKEYEADRPALIRILKRDWYDLDFRYLREHPDFRAFRLYEGAAGFKNDFLPFFGRDAFDSRREAVCRFYRGPREDLNRAYAYLTPEQADLFVREATESVMDGIRAELSVWQEGNTLRLSELQPSQFCVSEKKLRNVRAWFDPSDLSGFDAIPVMLLNGIPVMTDGHTRAAAAVLAGLDAVPLVWDRDELDRDMYAKCVEECRNRGIFSPADLTRRIVTEEEYRVKWDRWCDLMQAGVAMERQAENRT